LTIEVLDGSVQRELAEDVRRYAFTIAVTNASDAAQTIAAAALRVGYRTRANFLGAVDLPLPSGSEPTALRMPLRIDAGERVTRSAHLETSNIIPRHARIDGYTVLLADPSGRRWSADASLPQMLRDDHDGEGPRTWGWD
jgi:hypothetical protein